MLGGLWRTISENFGSALLSAVAMLGLGGLVRWWIGAPAGAVRLGLRGPDVANDAPVLHNGHVCGTAVFYGNRPFTITADYAVLRLVIAGFGVDARVDIQNAIPLKGALSVPFRVPFTHAARNGDTMHVDASSKIHVTAPYSPANVAFSDPLPSAKVYVNPA